MYIVNIEYDEKKECFKITLSNDLEDSYDIRTIFVTYNLYDKCNLKKGLYIDDNLKDKLEEDNNYIQARIIANRYVDFKLRTKSELIQRLYKEKYSKNIINKIVNNLEDKGLINDKSYSIQFAKYCFDKNMSKAKARNKMYQKGLSKDNIDQALLIYTDDSEYKNAYELAKKKKI